MKHTDACNEREKAVKDWLAKYPDYCGRCGGAGCLTTHGNRDTPPDCDACPDCVERGVCPLCTSDLLFSEHDHSDYASCVKCGFDEWAIINGTQQIDIIPEYDCHCIEDAYQEELDRDRLAFNLIRD